MFCASDERIVLGSKENLDENMANFSLKVTEIIIKYFFRQHFRFGILCANITFQYHIACN